MNTFLRGDLGDDKARAITSGLHTAKQIEAFETLMTRFTNQGASSSYSGAHREVPKTTISDEAYAKMSYTEKKAYAEAASQREHAIRR